MRHVIVAQVLIVSPSEARVLGEFMDIEECTLGTTRQRTMMYVDNMMGSLVGLGRTCQLRANVTSSE